MTHILALETSFELVLMHCGWISETLGMKAIRSFQEWGEACV